FGSSLRNVLIPLQLDAACNAASLSPARRRAASAPIRNRPARGNLSASDNLPTPPTLKSGADRDDRRGECRTDRKFHAPGIRRFARSAGAMINARPLREQAWACEG